MIYENGTESDLLLRSLAAALYSDGKRITENTDKLLDPLSGITEEDYESGYIYVVRSLSENPNIREIENLYKIGFSRGPVAERIKNAEKDPTYLMAPVEVVEQYRLLNVNVQKFEHLLHKFFW
ncbi:MAG: GIY-YIG nuclease family protein [Acidimicrobiia bacterium]